MPIVYCKLCGRKNRAPNEAIGKTGRCAGCAAVMQIPAQDEVSPEPVAPAQAVEALKAEAALPPPLPPPLPKAHGQGTQRPVHRRTVQRRYSSPRTWGCLAYFMLFGVLAVVGAGVLVALILPSTRRQAAEVSQKQGAEAYAVDAIKLYREAQDVYAITRGTVETRQPPYRVQWFAQALYGGQGTDGLFVAADGTLNTILLEDIAKATPDERGSLAVPYHGYFFKLLKAQGPNAAGGRRSYLDANGRMSGGHAILAYPAAYGSPGRKCFLSASTMGYGDMYARDLGPQTVVLVKSMNEFDPGEGWVLEEHYRVCPRCGGTGLLDTPCPACKGQGHRNGLICLQCAGKGKPMCFECTGTGKVP